MKTLKKSCYFLITLSLLITSLYYYKKKNYSPFIEKEKVSLSDYYKFTLFHPNFSKREWYLLTNTEREMSPFGQLPKKIDFERDFQITPKNIVKKKHEPHQDDTPRYCNDLSLKAAEVVVSNKFAAPKISIDHSDPLYPTISIIGSYDKNTNFYFEFDTSSTFNSHNYWRFPSLMPKCGSCGCNREDRRGTAYALFKTTARNLNGRDQSIVFPFRSLAMFIPMKSENLKFSDLVKFSQLLGIGLDEEEISRELLTIGTFLFDWGGDTYMRTPLNAFKARVMGCGNLNNLIGSMMEINGVRYRLVSGFNPVVREAYPGGGHSAIEVLIPGKGWSYHDSFFNIFTPGISTRDLSSITEGKMKVYDIDNMKFPKDSFGQYLTFSDLFKYRTYGDLAGRLPIARMTQLLDSEDSYGMNWSLRKVLKEENLDVSQDIPEIVTIFVRARYIKTKSSILYATETVNHFDEDIVASPWGYASFTLPARNIVSTLLSHQ